MLVSFKLSQQIVKTADAIYVSYNIQDNLADKRGSVFPCEYGTWFIRDKCIQKHMSSN